MYVELMKNFLVADSSQLMAVRLFRPPEPRNGWFLFSRLDVRRINEKFSSRRFERAIGCWTHFGLLSPKTFYSYFQEMIYGDFMENFLLADSSKLLAVRLILASWAQKLLISTLLTWCTSSLCKIFLSPIRARYWLLDSFWPREPKNVWFLLSKHDVRRVHEKLSSDLFDRADAC